MPVIRVSMVAGCDAVARDLIVRGIAGVVSDATKNSIDDVHIFFDELDRGLWSRGLQLGGARNGATPTPIRAEHVTVSTVAFSKELEQAYIDLRREVLNPGMASQAGFVSTMLLRPENRDNEFILVNTWLSEELAVAFEHSELYSDLKGQAMQILPRALDTHAYQVIHLDPAEPAGAPVVVVRVGLLAGRPIEIKQRMTREISNLVAELVPTKLDDVHVVFDEVPAESWGRGLGVAATRERANVQHVGRQVMLSRVAFDPAKEQEYLDLRRATLNPAMASQEGFISTVLLRPTSGAEEYLLLNTWRSKDHAEAWPNTPLHEEMKGQALTLLPRPLETWGAEIVTRDRS